MSNETTDHTGHPFDTLTPDAVIDAIESTGRTSDLRIFPLNSYENRVYQVGIEGGAPLIVKFYRPERWSEAAIREEHDFTRELLEAELPVVAPLADDSGTTLLHLGEFRFALFRASVATCPTSTSPSSCSRWGASSGACTPSARAALSRTARDSTSRASPETSCRLIDAGFIPPDLAPPTQPVRGAAAQTARTLPARRRHADPHPRRPSTRATSWPRRRAVAGGSRRLPQRAGDAGPVDAAFRRAPRAHRAARRDRRRLRGIPRLPDPRAAAGRIAAHPAPDALRRLAGGALGRPGLPALLPVVQHAALLVRAHPGVARAAGRPATRSRWRCSAGEAGACAGIAAPAGVSWVHFPAPSLARTGGTLP